MRRSGQQVLIIKIIQGIFKKGVVHKSPLIILRYSFIFLFFVLNTIEILTISAELILILSFFTLLWQNQTLDFINKQKKWNRHISTLVWAFSEEPGFIACYTFPFYDSL